MAGTTTAMCSSFKAEVLEGLHNFTNGTGNAFYIALVKVGPTGTYGAGTTNYSNLTGNSDEVANGSGYTTGGFALTNVTPTNSGTQGITNFSPNPNWTAASFSCTGAIIYNSTNGNRAVCVLDFGGTQTVTAGTLTIVMPAASAGTAIIQIQ